MSFRKGLSTLRIKCSTRILSILRRTESPMGFWYAIPDIYLHSVHFSNGFLVCHGALYPIPRNPFSQGFCQGFLGILGYKAPWHKPVLWHFTGRLFSQVDYFPSTTERGSAENRPQFSSERGYLQLDSTRKHEYSCARAAVLVHNWHARDLTESRS